MDSASNPTSTADREVVALEEQALEWLTLNFVNEIPENLRDSKDVSAVLRDGTVLCRILERCGHPVKFNKTAKHPVVCRANIEEFLNAAGKVFKINACLLFEPNDIVENKNKKQVVTCLLAIAKAAIEYGFVVPQIVAFELELDAKAKEQHGEPIEFESEEVTDPQDEEDIVEAVEHVEREQEESALSEIKLPQPPPQPMEEALKNNRTMGILLREHLKQEQISVIRLTNGQFAFKTADGKESGAVFVRCLRTTLMVRVGGGWATLENFVQTRLGKSINFNLNATFDAVVIHAKKTAEKRRLEDAASPHAQRNRLPHEQIPSSRASAEHKAHPSREVAAGHHDKKQGPISSHVLHRDPPARTTVANPPPVSMGNPSPVPKSSRNTAPVPSVAVAPKTARPRSETTKISSVHSGPHTSARVTATSVSPTPNPKRPISLSSSPKPAIPEAAVVGARPKAKSALPAPTRSVVEKPRSKLTLFPS